MLFRSQVSNLPNVSNGLTNTRVTLSSPTYLTPGYEYALVIITDDYDLDAYVAELGKVRIGGGDLISKQPFTGSLFKSQNSRTWTPTQDEDMMFVLNRADFTTGIVGTAYFEEDKTKLPQDYSYSKYDSFEVQSDAIEIVGTNLTYYYKGKSNVTQTMDEAYTLFKPDARNKIGRAHV